MFLRKTLMLGRKTLMLGRKTSRSSGEKSSLGSQNPNIRVLRGNDEVLRGAIALRMRNIWVVEINTTMLQPPRRLLQVNLASQEQVAISSTLPAALRRSVVASTKGAS
jgi:hypothetical protein